MNGAPDLAVAAKSHKGNVTDLGAGFRILVGVRLVASSGGIAGRTGRVFAHGLQGAAT
jgi:hypothetical protein